MPSALFVSIDATPMRVRRCFDRTSCACACARAQLYFTTISTDAQPQQLDRLQVKLPVLQQQVRHVDARSLESKPSMYSIIDRWLCVLCCVFACVHVR